MATSCFNESSKCAGRHARALHPLRSRGCLHRRCGGPDHVEHLHAALGSLFGNTSHRPDAVGEHDGWFALHGRLHTRNLLKCAGRRSAATCLNRMHVRRFVRRWSAFSTPDAHSNSVESGTFMTDVALKVRHSPKLQRLETHVRFVHPNLTSLRSIETINRSRKVGGVVRACCGG